MTPEQPAVWDTEPDGNWISSLADWASRSAPAGWGLVAGSARSRRENTSRARYFWCSREPPLEFDEPDATLGKIDTRAVSVPARIGEVRYAVPPQNSAKLRRP